MYEDSEAFTWRSKTVENKAEEENSIGVYLKYICDPAAPPVDPSSTVTDL